MSHASPEKDLLKLVASLSTEQQQAVQAFILYLREKSATTNVQSAVDEFVREHSELLRRLAQ